MDHIYVLWGDIKDDEGAYPILESFYKTRESAESAAKNFGPSRAEAESGECYYYVTKAPVE